MVRWHYQGDINLEHGGLFVEFSEWRHGYVNAVDVTDLDSATGAPGMMLIESKSILIDQTERYADVLSVIGASLLPNGDIDDNGHVIHKNTLAWKWYLVYAHNAYGRYNTDRSEVVQPDPTGPLAYNGWQATRIHSNALRSFVRKQFLGLAR